MRLEELILRHALDRLLPQTKHGEASGVMMISIPWRGIFMGAHNLKAALRITGIGDIEITASPGQVIARHRKARATWASFSRRNVGARG